MDGYAVRLADVVSASADAPVHLPVVGAIGAGAADLRELPEGTAAKIMTGAPVPAGADAVVPYEWTDRGAEHVRIERAPTEGQHVRRAGEDVSAGDLVLETGTVLGPRQLGLLASLGHARVAVRHRPRVVVLSTGSELREPGQPLGHDSIHDGNSFLPPPPAVPARSSTGSGSSPTSPRPSSPRSRSSWSARTSWSPRAGSRWGTTTW
jgi:molybdopterin molybdotransferase